MLKIKNMVLVILLIQMVQCIREIGRMVKNMDKDLTIQKMDCLGRGNGKMVKELNGHPHTKLLEESTYYIS
jgi:hypothetical protein